MLITNIKYCWEWCCSFGNFKRTFLTFIFMMTPRLRLCEFPEYMLNSYFGNRKNDIPILNITLQSNDTSTSAIGPKKMLVRSWYIVHNSHQNLPKSCMHNTQYHQITSISIHQLSFKQAKDIFRHLFVICKNKFAMHSTALSWAHQRLDHFSTG